MAHFSVIFSLCFLAILAGSIPVGPSTTIETLWNSTHDVRNDENQHIDLLNNVQNSYTKQFLLDKNLLKNTTQVGEHEKNPLYLNKTSDASTISTIGDFSSSKDMQHLSHNESREDDTNHKEGPSISFSSHDILLDPGLIPARLNRQAEKVADYSNFASIENISSDESNDYDKNRNAVPSKRSSQLEGDLDVAEDRYQPPYPYWNPYYPRQFPNQRYRANDRREPYRNYWRYPVFPGK